MGSVGVRGDRSLEKLPATVGMIDRIARLVVRIVLLEQIHNHDIGVDLLMRQGLRQVAIRVSSDWLEVVGHVDRREFGRLMRLHNLKILGQLEPIGSLYGVNQILVDAGPCASRGMGTRALHGRG